MQLSYPRTGTEFVAHVRSRLTYPPTGCWEWPIHAARISNSPVARFRGKTVYVARVLWLAHYRTLPKARLWRICPNKSCVSPLHRREGGKYAPHAGPRAHWPEEDRDWKPSDVPPKRHREIDHQREVARKAEAFVHTGRYPFTDA